MNFATRVFFPYNQSEHEDFMIFCALEIFA